MSAGFPAAARAALADAQLRRNLRTATSTIRARRAEAIAELPDWEGLRTQAAEIKERALRHLDVHLERLEQSVSAAGGQVHWARDAAEANALVGELIRAAGSDEAIKVKSLATDEIGLNEALAAQGITANETDLAELIVQLSGDRPSHILVPAIHRNRAEIRDLFERELGERNLPLDPTALTAAARRYLRERFMRVGVGVSGANFAVAETGTIVVVESEGNGRMCTTLPRYADHGDGHREGAASLRRPRGDAPAAAALLDRRADEPLHVAVDRGHAGDGPQRVPPRPARQRPHARARRHDRPPGAALHPLLRLPERLPGVRAHRRTRLRVDLSGADRRDPRRRSSRARGAARRCPGPPRCAAPATRSAR